MNLSPRHRKQGHYRFCWYLPLARLRLRWVAAQRSPDLRLHAVRSKMHLLRRQLRQHTAVRTRGGAAHPEVLLLLEE